MAEKGFRKRLALRQMAIKSLVCVGLDPLEGKIPPIIKKFFPRDLSGAVYCWMAEIVNTTAPFASMFKLQRAHYEAIPNGAELLRSIVFHIKGYYPDIPVFLDCKRGDIARTQQCYRIAHFEIDGVDGMNFNPYMGSDCMSALVDKDHLKRAIVGLCYTSNPAAREVQDVKLADGRYYWEFMAERILGWANNLGVTENAGLVMAAAYESPKGSGNVFSWHLKRCREIVSELIWLLIPGIGTQQGAIEETVEHGYAGPGSMAINSSSGIIFASSERDYAEAAAAEAMKLRDDINKAMGKFRYTYDSAT